MGPNARRLQELYDRFWKEGDWEAGRGVLARDIEWNGLDDGTVTLGGTRHGAVEVGEFFREWLEAWEQYSNETEVIEATEDVIVVESRFRGRGKGSGIEFETDLGQVWEFRDGRAVRQTMFRTHDEAHRAAAAVAAKRV